MRRSRETRNHSSQRPASTAALEKIATGPRAPAAPPPRHHHARPGTPRARRPAPSPRRARRTSTPGSAPSAGRAGAARWRSDAGPRVEERRGDGARPRAQDRRRVTSERRVAALRRQAGGNRLPLRIDKCRRHGLGPLVAGHRGTRREPRVRRGALVQVKPVEGPRGGAVRVEGARD